MGSNHASPTFITCREQEPRASAYLDSLNLQDSGVRLRLSFLAIGMLIALSLSACSTGEPVSSSTSAETPSQNQPQETPSETEAESEIDTEKAQDSEETSPESKELLIDSFREITYASCEKALAEGVVEKSVEPEGLVLVMIPKREAIAGYSAAYFLPPNTYELIFETDVFSSCALANLFSLSEEAGQEVELEITRDKQTNTFLVTQDLGEWGVTATSYEVKAELIVAATNLNAETGRLLIEYGQVSDADRAIIQTSVDRFSQE